MSIDRSSLSNGAISRTRQSTGMEALRTPPLSRRSRVLFADDARSLSESARNTDRVASMTNNSGVSRLDSVREAIANGTYKVSGPDIASKLISLNTR